MGRESAKKQWQFVAFSHQSRIDKLYIIIVKLLFYSKHQVFGH